MAFEKLTTKDQKIVLRAMKLILTEEKYIEDSEFQTRLGIERDQLRQVINEWPHLKDDGEANKTNPNTVSILAINNSLNEVCHGIRVSIDDWAKWFDETEEEVKRAYATWADERGRSSDLT